ncbi:extracellular solute-binding protein [Phaeobacter sp. PT47_59]|uniref:ABC transporter substrate-binding protein n=1 Tax=Phaeobacter sp. PT47_59 TaxID=3029979 RepID=UPI0023801154|nr:extracellular solute-binding protein [Phaeobacter sp. PT47_59]MDE4175419.1 extracellular solute-binding protein [Phaeobacter sp. PT47_59]
MMPDNAIGQLRTGFPEGAPSALDLWKKETGIEVEVVGASSTDIFTKVMQDVTTGDGSIDVYSGPWNSTGDLVASGGALDCTDYVTKYQPDWGDPERGVSTKEVEQLLYTYNGKYYSFALDGDFQTWYYLKGLYEKPEVQEAFLSEVGYELRTPDTWEQVDAISKFFTGKDFGYGTMYGNGNLMSPFWGLSTFYMRLASMDAPNYYFFDEDGNPQMNTDLAIQCTEEHVRSLEWSPPDALTFTFAESFAAIWNCRTPQSGTYTAVGKFGDGYNADGTPKSKSTGMLGCHGPVGRVVGDKLVRRSALYYSITSWVSSKSANPEAAYLFLQWLSSTRMFTWMVSNPSGTFDPFQQANLVEPFVIDTYFPYTTDAIPASIETGVPTLNFAGQSALDTALDEELQAALTGQKTSKEAMDAVQSKWERIIRRQERNGIRDAIKASRASWPTVVENI